MRGNEAYQANNAGLPCEDPVRRQAYEGAMRILAGRAVATAGLTDVELARMMRDPRSETVGRPDLPGSSR